jgi:shikimate dehydrogenase
MAAFRAEKRDALYEAFDCDLEKLPKLLPELESGRLRGINLTAPLKEEALKCCTSLTAEAALARAVNTIRYDALGSHGHNTDGTGLAIFLERHGFALAGARVVFLGAGGSVRGIASAFQNRSVATMTALARSDRAPIDGVRFVRDASSFADATLVIRALPASAGPLFADEVPPEAVAIDLGYHPAVTPWLAAVRARGVKAANGLGMLIEQALLAQEFWHGTMPPRSALEEAVEWSDPFQA